MTRARHERRVPAAVHGGPDGTPEQERAVRVDFSVSLNAYGAAPAVRDALRTMAESGRWHNYPDPASTAARRAVGKRWSCAPGTLSIGAGAADLIAAAAHALVSAKDVVLVPRHGFAEYERAAALAGGRVVRVGSRAASLATLGRGATVDAWCTSVRCHRPALVCLCTPGNPAGRAWTRDELSAVADECERVEAVMLIDQAYDAFTANPFHGPALPSHAAALHLLSLTKSHALAGVRVAVAHGAPPVIRALDAVRPPWPVSAFTQVAAVACMRDDAHAHVMRTTRLLRRQAARVATELAALGIATAPTATHILLARVGDGAAVRAALLAHQGIRVRDCTSFGLPQCIRVAARRPAENAALLSALASVSAARVSRVQDRTTTQENGGE